MLPSNVDFLTARKFDALVEAVTMLLKNELSLPISYLSRPKIMELLRTLEDTADLPGFRESIPVAGKLPPMAGEKDDYIPPPEAFEVEPGSSFVPEQ